MSSLGPIPDLVAERTDGWTDSVKRRARSAYGVGVVARVHGVSA